MNVVQGTADTTLTRLSFQRYCESQFTNSCSLQERVPKLPILSRPSMRSLCIRNGPKPLTVSKEDEGGTTSMRAYQTEMLQSSLGGNTIVVVCFGDPFQRNSLS